MNKVVLVGRLTRDPEVRYSQGDSATAVARYTVAVDRRLNGTTNRPLILFRVLYSVVLLSLQRSISVRECACQFPDVSRPEAIRTKTVCAFIQPK